jgi:hypothetical protein
MSEDNKGLAVGLTIDWETADRITVLNLKECLIRITEEAKAIESLMDQGDLAEYQKRDYVDHVSDIKAMERVLKYFGA